MSPLVVGKQKQVMLRGCSGAGEQSQGLQRVRSVPQSLELSPESQIMLFK